MTSTAILIGNAAYERDQALPCCREDVEVMRRLLEATGRFDAVHAHVDLDADAMRNAVRDALPTGETHDEVVFYYSGHGVNVGKEAYLCGTTFDMARPNETGVPHGELMDLFRGIGPDVLVTIIDACYSGALLVKGDRPLAPVIKDGLRNVLQFSSSLDDQTSLAGDSLSAFTHAFIKASLRKTEGTIYYTDVKNILRDEFIGNDDQTPFFVNQGTGREVLVDDARKLETFREEFGRRFAGNDGAREDEDAGAPGAVVVAEPLTPVQLLAAAEERMGGPEDAKELIDSLFDGLKERFAQSEFAQFFETQTVEYSTYREPVIEEFMIRVLAREQRPDRLVTAEIKNVRKKPSPWEQMAYGMMLAVDQEWTERFTLDLNCTLARAQLKLTLTPLYKTLQQLQLVVSCAPSLARCYVFEMVTQHMRSDWDEFHPEGRELVRRWYRLDWDEDPDFLIGKICEALTKAVRDHIDEMTRRLAED